MSVKEVMIKIVNENTNERNVRSISKLKPRNRTDIADRKFLNGMLVLQLWFIETETTYVKYMQLIPLHRDQYQQKIWQL